jgi:ketosteroid isomerase-like protein
VVASFVDCINRRDLDGLGALMSDDHLMVVFGNEPIQGRAASLEVGIPSLA